MSKAHWKADFSAGVQVFLIALPLSLGIAIASGFPPLAGIVAAVVGGLVVSKISGSYVTINGPAAGLIVVILASVDSLGKGDPLTGYRLTLAAIVCAGIIQIILGLLRAGRLSAFFPGAVVHGMLAAIGVIIMVKQFPVMIGAKPAAASVFGILLEAPRLLLKANPAVALIGISSLAVLIALKMIPWKPLRALPGPIVVVVLGSAAAAWLGFASESQLQFAGMSFEIGPKLLVSLPKSLFASLGSPDFSQIAKPEFVAAAVSIALVASLETLLSAAAVDKLDPERRKSDLNRDLTGIGVGTVISGLAGGLPMIAEIVRSSANVASGGRTSWANFFHGALLLLAILLFPGLLRTIPLSALAALLVFTGYRLASPSEFVKMKNVGYDQLLIFASTLIAVLATDLLVGVGVGIVVKGVLHLARQVPAKHLLQCRFNLVEGEGRQYLLTVHSSLVFCNLLPVLNVVEALPRGASLKVDLSNSPFIDHTAIERLTDLGRQWRDAGGDFEIEESHAHQRFSSHQLAARRLRV